MRWRTGAPPGAPYSQTAEQASIDRTGVLTTGLRTPEHRMIRRCAVFNLQGSCGSESSAPTSVRDQPTLSELKLQSCKLGKIGGFRPAFEPQWCVISGRKPSKYEMTWRNHVQLRDPFNKAPTRNVDRCRSVAPFGDG
jgi:hypothetical protein